MAPTAVNALGRTLMGVVLVAVGSAGVADDEEDGAEAAGAEGETVQLQLRGDGPLGSVVAISDARGRVRGTVSNPDVHLEHADGSPDVARAIGLGQLTVVRHKAGWRQPYTGTVPLVSGEIAKDITLYLSESEQIPSAMGLGVAMAEDASAVVGAGFLVQIMPGALPEEIERVEANVHGMPKLSDLVLTGTDCDDLLDRLLDGLGSRARQTSRPIFYCPCTRERARRTLALLDPEELHEIVETRQEQEVRCQFCGRAYDITPDEVSVMLADT